MLALCAAPPFPSRPTLLGPAGVPQMFVLFLLLQEKYPKEGEKRGTPPFPSPVSVGVPAIQRRRPNLAYTGTPAPTTVPSPDVVPRQGPQSTPGLVPFGKPHVGADAHIRPSLCPACGRVAGETSTPRRRTGPMRAVQPLWVHSRNGSVPSSVWPSACRCPTKGNFRLSAPLSIVNS